MTRPPPLGVLAILTACGGTDLVLPSDGSPVAIAIVSGNEQSGRVGAVLADPIVARVTDALNRPVAGVAVASTFDGGPGTSVVPDTTITDTDGHASFRLQLGTKVGAGSGAVRVVGTGGSVIQTGFAATAVSASASEMRMVSGDEQTGRVGTVLPERLVVKVTDAFGNPNDGVTITWAVTGGGNVSASSTVTGVDGRASVERTLGSAAGVQTTRASAPGLAGSPVVFTHTVTAAAASRITIVSGNNQTGAVAAPLPQDLVVRILDARGKAIAGAAVSWVVTAGGGSVTSTASTTGANGRASTRWTLGSTPGANRLEARVSGLNAVPFTATATTGASASLAIRTQPSANAVVGLPFDQQPVVQLRDAAGNDVERSGVAVTAAVTSGDGTLAGTTTRTTDGNGRVGFGNLRIGGAIGSHTLIFAASGHTSVSSNVIEVHKASTTTTITSDTPDPSAPNQAVTVIFSVTSNSGTPSGAVTVVVSGAGESCTANVSAGSCALVLTGEGSRTLTASYGGDALFDASSGTESHGVQRTNGAPTAGNDAYTTLEGFEKTLAVPAPGVLANDIDPDGDPLRAEIVTNPTHGTVTLHQDGSFTYHPEPDYWGDDAFTYSASDGTTTSSTATVAITVMPVNDAPVFRLRGGDQTVAANGGPQQVPGFTEIVSPGAPNEQGQTLQFLVEVDRSGANLFSQAPAISADGTLTYVPSKKHGTALVTVRLHDNGGTDNGGQDTSEPQSFTIAVTRSSDSGSD